MSWYKQKVKKQQKEFLIKIRNLKKRPKKGFVVKPNTERTKKSEHFKIENCSSNHREVHYFVKNYLSQQLQLIR